LWIFVFFQRNLPTGWIFVCFFLYFYFFS
jgi:hypothetical protein